MSASPQSFTLHPRRPSTLDRMRAVLPLLLCLHGAPVGPATDGAWFPAVDGTNQWYVESLPDEFSPSTPSDVVVFLHGRGADRWQYELSGGDELRALREMAQQRRLVVIAPDYRGPDSWMAPAAEADLAQIIRDVRARYTVRRLLLVGVSMGGTSALLFASRHPEIVDGVVAMAAATNLADIYAAGPLLQDSLSSSGADMAGPDPSMAARLTMPVALAVGGQDRIIPPGSVRTLAVELRAAGRAVMLIDRHDGGHDTQHGDALALLEFALGPHPSLSME